MKWALFVVLFAFASCGSVRDAFDSVKKTADAGTAFFKEAQKDYTEARAQADTDGDGKVTGVEWWQFLVGLLGLGGIGLARNGKSNERKAKTEAKTDALEEKVAELRSRVDGWE